MRKIADWGRLFYPSFLWSFSSTAKEIYLTFDDGPVPEVTLWVLQLLERYDARATFFCIGENIQKHPEIYRQLLIKGHSTGNHTFNHLNGWKTRTSTYIENILKAGEVMAQNEAEVTQETGAKERPKLFRPPYGKITPAQGRQLKKLGFKIVMWETISRDYDQSISAEDCYHNVIRNSGTGSIVVFHDSIKASENMQLCLPRILEHYHRQGFKFKAI